MNEIMEKTYELIDVLEESNLIKDLEKYREVIYNNKELRQLIDKGNNISDDYLLLDIKKKLYSDNDYKNYMDKYNELLYIVMDINNRFKDLTRDSRGCRY